MASKVVAKAKIANLIGESQIAINKGSNASVRKGDTVVLSERVTVTDPDTGEPLGVVLVPTLRFEVSMVAEKYSLARVLDRQSGKGGWGTGILAPVKTVTTSERSASENNVLVTIGDEVIVRREEAPTQEEEPPF